MIKLSVSRSVITNQGLAPRLAPRPYEGALGLLWKLAARLAHTRDISVQLKGGAIALTGIEPALLI